MKEDAKARKTVIPRQETLNANSMDVTYLCLADTFYGVYSLQKNYWHKNI